MSEAIRHVLLTGASGGIGRALALAFAAPDVSLSLGGRDAVRLEETAALCRARGARADIARIDAADAAAMREWVLARDDYLPVDLVLANAGIASTLAGKEPTESWETVERLFQVNLLGALATIQPLAERMAARRGGRIGLMSSLGGYVGMPISPAYNASKAALRVYGEGLRGRLAPHGVSVTVICPGFVDSAMSRAYPGPTPFLWDAARAAARIRDGLLDNRALVAFPWPLYLSLRLLSMLPVDLSLALQRWFRF